MLCTRCSVPSAALSIQRRAGDVAFVRSQPFGPAFPGLYLAFVAIAPTGYAVRRKRDVDLVDEWAVRLAGEVAPDEVETAPMVAEAFIAGGEARRELFATRGGTVGGFSPDDFSLVIPALFQSLSVGSGAVLAMLGAENLGKFLDCIENGLSLIGLRPQRKPSRSSPDTPSSPVVPPEEQYAPLRRAIEAMSTELRAQGLSEDQADLVTFRTLRALLESPSDAAVLVRQVSKGGES